MPRGRKKKNDQDLMQEIAEEEPDIACETCWHKWKENCPQASDGAHCTRWTEGEPKAEERGNGTKRKAGRKRKEARDGNVV